MKFCFFGYDYTLDIARRLCADGHELVQIFTFPCDNVYVFNEAIKNYAQTMRIPITESHITPKDVKYLIKKGCTLFFSSGYPHKIPAINEDKAYGVNLHPTHLPRARGIMPVPHIIMKAPEAGGFTLHKLTQEFDAGDILYQEKIKIDETTDIETYNAKMSLRTANAASDIIKNLEHNWQNATPQNHDKATEYGIPDDQLRTLHWNETVEVLCRKGRAFGRFGVYATITNQSNQSHNLAIFQFSGWAEQHNHKAGMVLRSHPNEIVIACIDGYICLKNFQVIG